MFRGTLAMCYCLQYRVSVNIIYQRNMLLFTIEDFGQYNLPKQNVIVTIEDFGQYIFYQSRLGK